MPNNPWKPEEVDALRAGATARLQRVQRARAAPGPIPACVADARRRRLLSSRCAGVEKYGTGNWQYIKDQAKAALANRCAVCR
jgi:hypothetical protein